MEKRKLWLQLWCSGPLRSITKTSNKVTHRVFPRRKNDKMATTRTMFSEQSNHPLEESSGDGLLKPKIIPLATRFQGTSSSPDGPYTARFKGAYAATTKPPTGICRSKGRRIKSQCLHISKLIKIKSILGLGKFSNLNYKAKYLQCNRYPLYALRDFFKNAPGAFKMLMLFMQWVPHYIKPEY